MISRLLALIVTAALALGVAGSASALNQRGGNRTMGPTQFIVTGTWDTTYTYGVNGKRRTCTLTRGAKCVGAKLRGTVKHHGDLRKANLRRADLRFADLRGANLKWAKLQYATPVNGKKAKRGNDLLCDPFCGGADLKGANLAGADLAGAHLNNANLSFADLTNADLTLADLASTNMTGANLSRAGLANADLTDANLTNADLTGANLFHANLFGADLGGANLTGVTWNTTTCPNGSVAGTWGGDTPYACPT